MQCMPVHTVVVVSEIENGQTRKLFIRGKYNPRWDRHASTPVSCGGQRQLSAHNVTYKDIFDYVHSNGKCLFIRPRCDYLVEHWM